MLLIKDADKSLQTFLLDNHVVPFTVDLVSTSYFNVINKRCRQELAKQRTCRRHPEIRGMFEMNCLLSSSSISTWGTIKTNTCLYRAIQYLHNGV